MPAPVPGVAPVPGAVVLSVSVLIDLLADKTFEVLVLPANLKTR